MALIFHALVHYKYLPWVSYKLMHIQAAKLTITSKQVAHTTRQLVEFLQAYVVIAYYITS